jgi:hypothetical protein
VTAVDDLPSSEQRLGAVDTCPCVAGHNSMVKIAHEISHCEYQHQDASLPGC